MRQLGAIAKKGKRNKIVSFIKGTLFSVAGVLLLLAAVSYMNHKIHLGKEEKLYDKGYGSRIEVNGHFINVYSEGEGEAVLVFLSGGGTSSPVLDFKSLYSLLSDKYKVAVVEKTGYGFSDNVAVPRDIRSVLEETRQGLLRSGIKGPYVLVPHSMSGLHALYWAQQYPEEVSGIIGLDMAVPQSYESYRTNMPLAWLGAVAARLGITRWLPGASESDAIKYGTLSDEEKELYRTVFYRRTATKPMLAELQEVKASALKVAQGEMTQVPVLIFSSNGEGTGWKPEAWKEAQRSFAEEMPNREIVDVDSSHYIHDIQYDVIAETIKGYVEKTQAHGDQ